MANVIQGGLPWGFAGGAASGNYASAYASALAMNQQNYANILSGYQQTAQQQAAAQDAVTAGYGSLSGAVLGGISGIGAAQYQQIKDQYAAQRGASAQGLINAGLGNTTVTASTDRGFALDRAKAETGLAGTMAGLQAQYQANIGLAGLNWQGQAVRDNTALANQQLQWMNSVQAEYPDLAAYMAIEQQRAAAEQAERYAPYMTPSGVPGGGRMTVGGAGASPFKSSIDWGGGGGGGAGMQGLGGRATYAAAFQPMGSEPWAPAGGSYYDDGGGGWMGRQADNWAGAAAGYDVGQAFGQVVGGMAPADMGAAWGAVGEYF